MAENLRFERKWRQFDVFAAREKKYKTCGGFTIKLIHYLCMRWRLCHYRISTPDQPADLTTAGDKEQLSPPVLKKRAKRSERSGTGGGRLSSKTGTHHQWWMQVVDNIQYRLQNY